MNQCIADGQFFFKVYHIDPKKVGNNTTKTVHYSKVSIGCFAV